MNFFHAAAGESRKRSLAAHTHSGQARGAARARFTSRTLSKTEHDSPCRGRVSSWTDSRDVERRVCRTYISSSCLHGYVFLSMHDVQGDPLGLSVDPGGHTDSKDSHSMMWFSLPSPRAFLAMKEAETIAISPLPPSSPGGGISRTISSQLSSQSQTQAMAAGAAASTRIEDQRQEPEHTTTPTWNGRGGSGAILLCATRSWPESDSPPSDGAVAFGKWNATSETFGREGWNNAERCATDPDVMVR